MLMIRRFAERKQESFRSASSRSKRGQTSMAHALRILAQRFMLQQDERAHEELKSKNDRERYEILCHLACILLEALTTR